MPGMIKNKIGDLLFICWESIAIDLDNWITGLVEMKEVQYNSTIRDNLRAIAERHLPFTDKIDELKTAAASIEFTDDTVKQQFLTGLDDIAKKGVELKNGVKEVENLIETSNMTFEEKSRLITALRTCEMTMKDYYCSKIPPYTYKKFMAVMRKMNAAQDLSIVEQQNGSFLVFYPAQHIELVDHALEFATLSYQMYPSENAIERSAYMGAADTSKASVLKFDNLPLELAEKAVENARRYGFVEFAKVKMPGTDPQLYQLVCEGGSTQEERDRNYREAIEIISKSAIAVSGPAREAERKKMAFNDREFQRLNEGLKSGSGYVFSVRPEKYKNNAKEKESYAIDSRNFVRFEKDSKSGRGQFYTQKDGIITTTVYESETEHYDRLLYHTVNAGFADKIYISDENMDKMRQDAHRIFTEIQNGDKEWSSADSDPLAGLISKINLHRDKAFTLQKQSPVLYRAEMNDVRDLDAIKNIVILNKEKDIKNLTEEDILYGVISSEIDYKHTFKMKELNGDISLREAKAIEDTINRMTSWSADNSKEETILDIENKLRTESATVKEDYSIGPVKVIKMINRFDPNAFIAHEFSKASADQIDNNGKLLNKDTLTIHKVNEEKAQLDKYYKETADRAKKMLEDVRVHMVEAKEPLDCMDIENRYTKLVHLTRTDLLNAIEPLDTAVTQEPLEELTRSQRPIEKTYEQEH